jgi:hypothetical protein
VGGGGVEGVKMDVPGGVPPPKAFRTRPFCRTRTQTEVRNSDSIRTRTEVRNSDSDSGSDLRNRDFHLDPKLSVNEILMTF